MNWWLAALEYYGLLTREEALHIADNIKNSIHKDNYIDAYDELSAILSKAKVKTTPVIAKVQSDFASSQIFAQEQADKIAELRKELDELKADHTTKTKPIALAKN